MNPFGVIGSSAPPGPFGPVDKIDCIEASISDHVSDYSNIASMHDIHSLPLGCEVVGDARAGLTVRRKLGLDPMDGFLTGTRLPGLWMNKLEPP